MILEIDLNKQSNQQSCPKPMFVPGQILKGGKSAYRLTEQLKVKEHIQSTLWKAEVLDNTQYEKPVKSAIVKTSQWERRESLNRERIAYRQPSIQRSRYIRSMYDEINELTNSQSKSEEAFRNAFEENPFCLVLEHLDCSLQDLEAERYKRDPAFVAEYFKSMLTGVFDIGRAKAIWTDAKTENILCSNFGTSELIIKISDLGLIGPTDFDENQLQPLHTRAPEVWAGHPCTHIADLWSIAVTFVSWIDDTIFGYSDWKDGIPFVDAWCIAKVIRGFETDEDQMPSVPPQEKSNQQDWLYIKNVNNLGRLLLTQPDDGDAGSMHVPTRPFFAEVLPELGLTPEVGALLRKMLVLDPDKRMTAEALLQCEEYQALLAAAK